MQALDVEAEFSSPEEDEDAPIGLCNQMVDVGVPCQLAIQIHSEEFYLMDQRQRASFKLEIWKLYTGLVYAEAVDTARI